MRTPVCWTERLADGRRKSVEVVFSGKDQIEWRIEITGREDTVILSEPTGDDWSYLIAIVEKWYVRRRIPYKYVALVRNIMKK